MSTSQTAPCGRVVKSGKKPVAVGWRDRLEEYLRKSGLRFSKQRFKMAEIILSQEGHLSAVELLDKVKKVDSAIGAATVYRNLKVLCEAGILKQSFSDSKGAGVFERYDEDHHDHIICMECGLILEFHSEKIESLQKKLAKQLAFKEVSHRHVVYAKCTYRK